MRSAEPYSDAETQALARDLVAGRALSCPRCGAPLDRRPVPPRPDVSYVRDRLWVMCAPCHRSAVLDPREAR